MAYKQAYAAQNMIKDVVKYGIDNDVIVSGIFATTDRDVQGDSISKAFLKKMAKALNSGVPCYLNHGYTNDPVGEVIKAVYRESEDGSRAWVEGDIVIDTNNEETKRNILRKRIPYFSIGGHLYDFEMQKGADGIETKVCLDGDILEVSITSVPINTFAGCTMAKGAFADLVYNNQLYKSYILNKAAESGKDNNSLDFKTDIAFVSEDEDKKESEMKDSDNNMIVKGDVSEFKKLNNEPDKTVVPLGEEKSTGAGGATFGTDTKFGEEKLEKYTDPGNPSNAANSDRLNQNDAQELFNKHKSQTATSDQNAEDRNEGDETARGFYGRHSTTPEKDAPNTYDNSNSVDGTGNDWLTRTKSFVQGLDSNVKKAAVIDMILHDFKSENTYQEKAENDIESIHRLIEQKNRFRKGSRQHENVVDEILHIIKGINWEEVESDPYAATVMSHLLGHHAEELGSYMEKAMPTPEEPVTKAMPMEEEAAAPMAAAPMAPTAGAAGEEMVGTPEEVDPFNEAVIQMAETNPEFNEALTSILMQYGLITENGEPVENAPEEAIAAATEDISQLLETYQATESGADAQAVAPENDGMVDEAYETESDYPSEEELNKAVNAAMLERQRSEVIRSQAIPDNAERITPVGANGKPLTAAQMQIAGFMSGLTTG